MFRFTSFLSVILLSLFLSSCGDSHASFVSGNQAPTVAPGTGTISVRHVLQRAVPGTIVSFRFSGLDAQGELKFGPQTVARRPPSLSTLSRSA